MPKLISTYPQDPIEFTAMIRKESNDSPVLVLKFSPICPISHAAEQRYRDWFAELAEDFPLKIVELDVIDQRPLARGLTAELDIQHESPQALMFQGGEVIWHDSHKAITADALSEALG